MLPECEQTSALDAATMRSSSKSTNFQLPRRRSSSPSPRMTASVYRIRYYTLASLPARRALRSSRNWVCAHAGPQIPILSSVA